jgi:antitoxin component YwqK of YwqJK toxin-antitoxin module
MENFQQVKTSLIEQAKVNNACSDQLELVIKAKTWSELKKVIIDNIGWCNEKGILVPDGHYKNNKYKFTIVNGKLHGEHFYCWIESKVQVKSNYVDGKKEGEFIRYHINGQVDLKCNYVNDKLHGKFVRYDNGDVIMKCNYVHGQLHGEHVRYYKNGQVEVKCNYTNGKLVKTVC